MKTRLLILLAFAGVIILGGCATTGTVTDDVYYVPQDNASVQVASSVQAKTQSSGAVSQEQPAEVSGDEVFSAIDDYYRDKSYNEDTLQMSEETYTEGEGNVIINNYDGSYAARINHFFYPSMGFGYYDPFYYGAGYGPGLGLSIGFGFGYGYGYGGYPYYNPWYTSYYPYMPYIPYYPYYPSYYGGCCYFGYAVNPVYPGDDSYSPRYGHRSMFATNRLYAPGSVETGTVKSSFIPSDSRRVSGTRRPAGTTTATATPRHRSTSAGVATTRSSGTVATSPAATTKASATRTATYQPRRTTTRTTTRVRTTRLPESTSATRPASVSKHRTTTSVNRTGRTYVPKYTNTKTTRTTARPTYNPSRNVGTISRSRSVTRSTVKSYSPTVKRSSSTYTPRRIYSPSRSSYTPRSSSSSSTSISAPRSSGSSSRSSGSGGRRR